MSIVEWDGPPVKRTSAGKKFTAIREELRKHPGRWGVVERDRRNNLPPKNEWDGFQVANRRDPVTGLITAYARWLGEEQA